MTTSRPPLPRPDGAPDADPQSSSLLHRLLLTGERVVDRTIARVRGAPSTATLVPHAGYEHAGGAEVFARVLERPERWMPEADDGRFANLMGVGSLFATSEVPGARVRIDAAGGPVETSADEEGYVRATLPAAATPAARTCWETVAAMPVEPPGESVAVPILRVGSSSRFAVLSDIDDTVMETGAENVARNLWTTFTGNALTRRVYPRVPELYRALHAHRDGVVNPVFYLSSSPWNLYRLIHGVLARDGVPWGPIFLRDYGLDERKLLSSTHGDHKLRNGRAVMDHLDGLPFVLIGDLGQKDPSIYAQLAREHPGQVAGVIIHRPSGREHADKLGYVKEIDAMGVPVVVTTDYAEAERLAREHHWID